MVDKFIGRENINPYFMAAGLFIKRLKWDLNYKSWDSRKKIKKLNNKYLGKKAVITCNGPSLNKVDFSLLKNTNIYTFGLNKINLLFDKTDFRPSCIVSVNPFVIDQNSSYFNSTDITLFISSNRSGIVNRRKNVIYINSCYSLGRFARNCNFSLNEGSTVTFVALQLAFHMGFSEVGIIGCDHYFSQSGYSNKTVTSESIDKDHFDSKYFADGAKWQLPDLPSSELHYSIADEQYKYFGRKIYNCTVGTKLNIFEKMNLNDFIALKK
jgi:hypothetical protein